MNTDLAHPLSTLRPDVAAVVGCHVKLFPATGGVEDWQAYTSAKRAIGRVCGWDAPTTRQDQAEYDRAVQAYIREVRL